MKDRKPLLENGRHPVALAGCLVRSGTHQLEGADMKADIRVEEYVTSSVQSFLGDPPDTNFQRGFLSAMLVVAEEHWGCGWTFLPSRKRGSC
jgi:hypothetical protein